jgi:hypothetical protein
MFIKYYEISVIHVGLILILVASTVADFSPNLLADNGGPTQILALLSGNSLNDSETSTNCPSIDQRGLSRLQGSLCNVGEYKDQDVILPADPQIIPTLNDWQAGSLAFSHGSEGEWDFILWGGFANSLIKKGNTYYLYYQPTPY